MHPLMIGNMSLEKMKLQIKPVMAREKVLSKEKLNATVKKYTLVFGKRKTGVCR